MTEQTKLDTRVGANALLGRAPCKHCPFREHASMMYDADAMEALDEGNDPACHEAVGRDAIFQFAPFDPPEKVACTGYRRWLAEVHGFKRPDGELTRGHAAHGDEHA